MGSVFFIVGPVRGENLVGLAAEQEVEFLLEDAVYLPPELLIEIGHRPAAELEALGRIFGRPAGGLHDTIHGHLGADGNLPHGSLSLLNWDNKLTGLHPVASVGLSLAEPSASGRQPTSRLPARSGHSGCRQAIVTRRSPISKEVGLSC